MGETTEINWAHHTRNYWMGCTKIGPGCDYCYAETASRRFGKSLWGDNNPRQDCTAGATREITKWNKKAETAGERRRVFINSFSDVLDHRAEQSWRDRIIEDAWACPSLDFLLLTKRIGNAAKMLPSELPPNVWLGITATSSEELRRDGAKLVEIPASVHWLSFEPALGPLDHNDIYRLTAFNWIIYGGESGPNARAIDIATMERLTGWRREGIIPPLWIKQWGERHAKARGWKHPHGADIDEWPEWAQVQETPLIASPM